MISFKNIFCVVFLTLFVNSEENVPDIEPVSLETIIETTSSKPINIGNVTSLFNQNFTSELKDFRTLPSVRETTEGTLSTHVPLTKNESSTVLSTLGPALSDALSSTTLKPSSTTPEVLKKWKHFENITKIFSKSVIKNILPGLMEGSGKLNVSDSCRKDVLKLIIGIRDIKTWAFSFIDASGKMIDGLLSGTTSVLGDYDQCLNIKVTNPRRGKNFGKLMFTGQYCALDIHPPLPPKPKYYKLDGIVEELKEFASGDNIINEAAKAAQFFHFLTMRVGICVPSGCGPSDLQPLLDIVANDMQWSIKVNRCELKQENEYTPLIIGIITVCSFFGFLLLVGSLIDLYHRHTQKKINSFALEILVSFSLPHNFNKLINTKNSEGPLSCLHGFRFLSISWIVLGHTYLNFNYIISKSLRKATAFQKDFFFQAVVNASVAVDTFFFIGGFLVCYATVKVVRDHGKPFNIFLYLLHRVFRLLPVYVIVVAFIFLAPICGSGPVYWDTLGPFLDACYKNWWTNILFVNNFIHTDQICLPQSWYVACDMQLYIAALIVILPILRWPRVGISIASFGILASVAGTAAMTYVNDYPPTMLFIHPDIEQRTAYWANAYFKPYSHAGPYCIGLIVGYVLATNPKIKFSLVTRIICWCISIVCNMSVLYGVYEWNVGRDPNLVETLLYSSLHRVAWTFGIAWIVLVCAAGQGGVVNYILSWKAWIPLGRLTYTIYLIHPIVQIAAAGNSRIHVMTKHYFVVWIYFGHLMITIGSSFVASMLVEAPFITLEKLLLRFLVGKSPNSSSGEQTRIPNGNTTAMNGDATALNGNAAAMNDNTTAMNGAVKNGLETGRNDLIVNTGILNGFTSKDCENGTENRKRSNGTANSDILVSCRL